MPPSGVGQQLQGSHFMIAQVWKLASCHAENGPAVSPPGQSWWREYGQNRYRRPALTV